MKTIDDKLEPAWLAGLKSASQVFVSGRLVLVVAERDGRDGIDFYPQPWAGAQCYSVIFPEKLGGCYGFEDPSGLLPAERAAELNGRFKRMRPLLAKLTEYDERLNPFAEIAEHVKKSRSGWVSLLLSALMGAFVGAELQGWQDWTALKLLLSVAPRLAGYWFILWASWRLLTTVFVSSTGTMNRAGARILFGTSLVLLGLLAGELLEL